MIPLLFFCILTSCNNKSPNSTTTQQNIPEALQDNKTRPIAFVSKSRMGNDLVEDLYKEIEESSPVLKTVKDQFKALNENKSDTIKLIEKFFSKNDSYYRDVFDHINTIRDSSLKNEIRLLFEKDRDGYNASIQNLKNKISQLNHESINTADKFITLKLVTTLTVMKQFREKNIPSSTGLQQLVSEFKKLESKMDSVINKNK